MYRILLTTISIVESPYPIKCRLSATNNPILAKPFLDFHLLETAYQAFGVVKIISNY